LTVEVDERHGGRWTSLRSPTREWLWRNPAVTDARTAVRPGAAFVDAGGGEECFPTVRGAPDHGDVWTREWHDGTVRTGALTLRREIRGGPVSTVTYEITGPSGTPFVHAVHLLLDVSEQARLEAAATAAHLLDAPGGTVAWPSGLDALGPDDGTAVAAVLTGCAAATVVDGTDALTLSWRVLSGEAECSLLLWRNLRGWPADGPYRSIGIEPMLGTAAALDGPGTPAVIPAGGRLTWELSIGHGPGPARRPRSG
jgi:hypothetical protein